MAAKFEIHHDGVDGHDFFVISGKTLNDVQRQAKEEARLRYWDINDCWSRRIGTGRFDDGT